MCYFHQWRFVMFIPLFGNWPYKWQQNQPILAQNFHIFQFWAIKIWSLILSPRNKHVWYQINQMMIWMYSVIHFPIRKFDECIWACAVYHLHRLALKIWWHGVIVRLKPCILQIYNVHYTLTIKENWNLVLSSTVRQENQLSRYLWKFCSHND